MHQYARVDVEETGSRSAPPPSPVQSDHEPQRSATSLHITLPSSVNPTQDGEIIVNEAGTLSSTPDIYANSSSPRDKDIVLSLALLEELSRPATEGGSRPFRTLELGLGTIKGDRSPPRSFSRRLSATHSLSSPRRRASDSDPPRGGEMARRVPRINIHGLENLENGNVSYTGVLPPRSNSARPHRTKALRTPRPNHGLRPEIAPLWIPPSSPENETVTTSGSLGTIGAEVRRRPKQRYVQQKLPVLNARTCTLHDKPKDGQFIIPRGDVRQIQETHTQTRTESPHIRTQSGQGLIRIPTGRLEDPSRRKEEQTTAHVKWHRPGFNQASLVDPEKNNYINGALINRPPKKTASSKRYIMTWLDAGSDDPQFSEKFKLQSAKYKSRKEIERLQKLSDMQINKSAKVEEKDA